MSGFWDKITNTTGNSVKAVCDTLEAHQSIVAAVIIVLLLVVIWMLWKRYQGPAETEGLALSNVTSDQTSGLLGLAGLRSDGVYGSCTGNETPGTAAFADCQARRAEESALMARAQGMPESLINSPGVNYFPPRRNDNFNVDAQIPSSVGVSPNVQLAMATRSAMRGQ